MPYTQNRHSFPIGSVLFILLLQLNITFSVRTPSTSTILGAPDASPQVQQQGQAWSEPVNLSQTGSTSQPRLVSTADGTMQAFWWDQFDGLMTAYFDGSTWTSAMFAPIDSDRLKNMPDLVLADNGGTIHAFWIETTVDSSQVETSALLHSQLESGTNKWSAPIRVAESVLAFSAIADPVQGVNLVYLRPKRSDFAVPGVYFNQIYFGLDGWSTAIPIYENIRYRLLTPGEADVSISKNTNSIFTAWDELETHQIVISESFDGGTEWNEPVKPVSSEQTTQTPRLISLDENQTLLIYRDLEESGCGYNQQINSFDPNDPSVSDTWSAPKQILGTISTCPESDRFLSNPSGLYWLWGEGSNKLRLFAWNSSQEDWLGPSILHFDFESPDSNASIFLSDLNATLIGNRLAVIGVDRTFGDIWVSVSEIPAADLINLPPSPWSDRLEIPLDHTSDGAPVLVIDDQQVTHIIWSGNSGTSDTELVGNVLYYARGESALLTPPVPIFSENDITTDDVRGVASQPALYFDPRSGNLHLVWSGGQIPDIFHSQANTSETISADSWLTPQNLSLNRAAESPQIGADQFGRLYVLYVVPINEGRGVYLVQSDDGGETWSSPNEIFDAEGSNWSMITQPSLAVAPNGTLHAAFVQATVPALGDSLGIFYSQSIDRGSTWTDPILLAGPGYVSPQLTIAGDQIHLLMNSTSSSRVYHRWAVLGEILPGVGWSLWSTIASVPSINAQADEYGVAGTLSAVYLATAPVRNGTPIQRTWDSETEQWANPEESSTFAAFGNASSSNKPFSIAVNSSTGLLSAAWFEPLVSTDQGPGTNTSLIFSNRSIPVEADPEQVVEVPVVTPEAETNNPKPTPTIIPTPILDQTPPASSSAISPFILGGVLAGLIVVGIFALLFSLKRN